MSEFSGLGESCHNELYDALERRRINLNVLQESGINYALKKKVLKVFYGEHIRSLKAAKYKALMQESRRDG